MVNAYVDRLVAPLSATNPHVRSITGAARNPRCDRRVALEVVGRAHLGEVAAACGARATLTPSIIATTRGERFEETVLGGDMVRLREHLVDVLGCEVEAVAVVDLRHVDDDANLLEARAIATRTWLEGLIDGEPSLARGASVVLHIGSLPVTLEMDALLWTGVELVVIEVKSIATLDGYTSGEDVAAAAAQAAVYVYALRALGIRHLGGRLDVASRAVLATARDFTFAVALHRIPLAGYLAFVDAAIVRLAHQVDTLLERLADDVMPLLDVRGLDDPPPGVHESNRRVVASLPANLVPGCLGACPMWEVCRDELRPAADPATYGSSHVEELAGVGSLHRVAALVDGADPSAAETELADKLVRIAALLDDATAGDGQVGRDGPAWD